MGSKNSGGLTGRWTPPHHDDKVAGSAQLPQVRQVDAGRSTVPGRALDP